MLGGLFNWLGTGGAEKRSAASPAPESTSEETRMINGDSLTGAVGFNGSVMSFNDFFEMYTGETLTKETGLQLSALYRGVNLLAGTIARLPVHVYKVDADGDRIIDRKHRFESLFNVSTNHITPAFNFRESMMMDLIWSDGNSYARKITDLRGQTIGLRRVAPEIVSPYLVDDERDYNIYYFINGKPDTQLNILHVAGMGFDGIKGISPLRFAKRVGEQGLTLDRFTSDFFKNNAHMGGVIEFPEKFSNPDKIKSYLDTWNEKSAGMQKTGKTGGIPAGAKYHQFELLAEAAQLLQSRQFSITEIGRFLGIPPHKLFELGRSTNNNIEHQNIEWVLDTVAIWCRRIEASYEHSLFELKEKGSHVIRHDLTELIKGDMKSVAEYLSKLVNSGILSSDEAREYLDYFKMGGDAAKLRFPVNTTTKINADNDGKEED